MEKVCTIKIRRDLAIRAFLLRASFASLAFYIKKKLSSYFTSSVLSHVALGLARGGERTFWAKV